MIFNKVRDIEKLLINLNDYFDGDFVSVTSTEDMMNRLNDTMPEGVKVLDIVELEDKGVIKTIFLQSVRLDSVISQAFNLSREEASGLIKHELVKVNQKVAVKSFQNLKACDIISVAHKGRIKIIDDSTTSRSGRIVMKIKIYR